MDYIYLESDKKLRDEFAMSMTNDSLPIIKDEDTLKLISEKYGLEWSDDPIKQIEWSLKYQAAMRYKYADAMLAARRKKI